MVLQSLEGPLEAEMKCDFQHGAQSQGLGCCESHSRKGFWLLVPPALFLQRWPSSCLPGSYEDSSYSRLHPQNSVPIPWLLPCLSLVCPSWGDTEGNLGTSPHPRTLTHLNTNSYKPRAMTAKAAAPLPCFLEGWTLVHQG